MERKLKSSPDIAFEIEGIYDIESMPFDLQQEFTRSSLGLAPHIWEGYSNEVKGKTIAVEVIKNKIEKLTRFHNAVERNRRNETKGGG